MQFIAYRLLYIQSDIVKTSQILVVTASTLQFSGGMVWFRYPAGNVVWCCVVLCCEGLYGGVCSVFY